LAVRYRERAVTEPEMAHAFIEIATDMETHAAMQVHADTVA
jgi:hypothetical protein